MRWDQQIALGGRAGQFDGSHREAEAVRSRHCQSLVAHSRQDAGKDWAGVIGRGGKFYLFDDLAQFDGVECDALLARVACGYAGELAGVHAAYGSLTALSAHLE